MSQLSLWEDPPVTLDERIAEARAIVAGAVPEHYETVATFVLFSGGNDSSVLTHLFGPDVDAVVHVNTGIGVEQTREFVRAACGAWGFKLRELHPPVPYEDICEHILGGFPGPAQHRVAYARLKERPLRLLRKEVVTAPRRQRVVFLTGIRAAESKQRMGYGRAVSTDGSTVWVNPLYHWDHTDMAAYRVLHDLPRNEVADNLHMSGECLCGAYARPGEIEQLAFFYPEVAARIRSLEAEFRAKGLKACTWGDEPPQGRKYRDLAPPGPLCQGCG